MVRRPISFVRKFKTRMVEERVLFLFNLFVVGSFRQRTETKTRKVRDVNGSIG